MQDNISVIKKTVGDIKSITSELASSSNHYPKTFLIKPRLPLETLDKSASTLSKAANFLGRKMLAPTGTPLWNESVLVFVCPVTAKEVPCGPDNKGYSIEIQTENIKALLPTLRWGFHFLRVALSTQGLGAAVPDLPSGVSNSLYYLNSIASSIVTAAGLPIPVGNMVDSASSYLARLPQGERPFTLLLNEFLRHQEGDMGSSLVDWQPTKSGLVKVSSDADGSVMWVSPQAVEAYRKMGKLCLFAINYSSRGDHGASKVKSYSNKKAITVNVQREIAVDWRKADTEVDVIFEQTLDENRAHEKVSMVPWHVEGNAAVVTLVIDLNGGSYEGEIVDGQANGTGVLAWDSGPNKGCRYEGTFFENKRHGYGIHTDADGRVYEGAWAADTRNGNGKLIMPDGRVYVGYFRNDKMHGLGKYSWPNGEVYEGCFVDNKSSGRGKFTMPGRVWGANTQEGIFKEGKFLGSVVIINYILYFLCTFSLYIIMGL